MSTIATNQSISAATSVADGAVGVPGAKWYVAIVNHNSEKNAAQSLSHLGYTTYVAAQPEMRVWANGRRKLIDRVVIPSMVFIRCTEQERLRAVTLPFIFRFLSDRAAGPRTVATIPDAQIDTLRFMLGNSDNPVDLQPRAYNIGDLVKVVRGKLKGISGRVRTSSDGTARLIVDLDILGCATTLIDPVNLEPIQQ